MTPEKRFKVVQSRVDGHWGILDLVASEFKGVRNFASYGQMGSAGDWLLTRMAEDAACLNALKYSGGSFTWSYRELHEFA